MGRRDVPEVKHAPLRGLPRVFVPGANAEAEIALPSDELDKLRKVLRLTPGAQIAVLPNNGSLIRCELLPKAAKPLEVFWPDTEAKLRITVAQALPKGDKLEEIVRGCTEVGVAGFVFFSSDRTVVRWDEKKTAEKLRRLESIVREAAELSFRTRLPEMSWSSNLKSVLADYPQSVVLSEVEGLNNGLKRGGTEITLVVGPEGGWTPSELALIGDRGVSLGPRVLRVDHAAFAAASALLIP